MGVGIDDFTYQIILQSLFIIKNYKLKDISKIVIIFSHWQHATLNNKLIAALSIIISHHMWGDITKSMGRLHRD